MAVVDNCEKPYEKNTVPSQEDFNKLFKMMDVFQKLKPLKKVSVLC